MKNFNIFLKHNNYKRKRIKLTQVGKNKFAFVYSSNSHRLDDKAIKNIIMFVNTVISQTTKFEVFIDLSKSMIVDKLSWVILETFFALIYKTFQLKIYCTLNLDTNIHSQGVKESALQSLSNYNYSHDEFLSDFNSLYNFNRYRKILKVETDKSEVSKVETDLNSYLTNLGINEQYSDDISECIGELVGNAIEHGKSDCLIDMDIALEYTHTETNVEYIGINVVILNFSQDTLGSKIKKKINENISLNERHSQIKLAYETHQKFFDERYSEEDFYNISAFQKKITCRQNDETGGKGLAKTIDGLHMTVDEYSCYIYTGDKYIFYEKDLCSYNTNDWVGFNEEQNFLKFPPNKSAFKKSNLYLPGVAYNFMFVVKKGD